MKSLIALGCSVMVLVLGCSASDDSSATPTVPGGNSTTDNVDDTARLVDEASTEGTDVGDMSSQTENVGGESRTVPGGSAGTEASGQTEEALPPPRTTWVNHYQVPCTGWEGKYLCHLVSSSPDGPWVTAYDNTGGVVLEWGHVYELELGWTEADGVGPDAPAVNTFTTAVLTDRLVDVNATTFEFLVDPQLDDLGYPTLELSEGGGELIDGTRFVCDSDELCLQLEAALTRGDLFVLEFGYGENTLPLVALSINECATERETSGPVSGDGRCRASD